MNTIVEESIELNDKIEHEGHSLFDHELTDKLEDSPKRLEAFKCGEDWPTKDRYKTAESMSEGELESEATWVFKVFKRMRTDMNKIKKDIAISKIKALLKRLLVEKVSVDVRNLATIHPQLRRRPADLRESLHRQKRFVPPARARQGVGTVQTRLGRSPPSRQRSRCLRVPHATYKQSSLAAGAHHPDSPANGAEVRQRTNRPAVDHLRVDAESAAKKLERGDRVAEAIAGRHIQQEERHPGCRKRRSDCCRGKDRPL